MDWSDDAALLVSCNQSLSNGSRVAAAVAGGPNENEVLEFYSPSTPHGPRIEQIRVSCKAGVILLAAFVLAFIMTVLLLLAFPRIRVKESDRTRLDAENQALKIENANLAIDSGG
jgi:hypothetical protein